MSKNLHTVTLYVTLLVSHLVELSLATAGALGWNEQPELCFFFSLLTVLIHRAQRFVDLPHRKTDEQLNLIIGSSL